jgi:hypothetical protein
MELGTHSSDRTVAAHGCNSIIEDVIRNAVIDSAAGPGGSLQAVAFEIRVSIREGNSPRLGVKHVVVQGDNEVANPRRAAHVLPSVGGGPGDVGGIKLGKVTSTAHDVKVVIQGLLRLLERHQEPPLLSTAAKTSTVLQSPPGNIRRRVAYLRADPRVSARVTVERTAGPPAAGSGGRRTQ